MKSKKNLVRYCNILFFLFSGILTHAQQYSIAVYAGDTLAACSGEFYDSGNDTADYQNDENYIVTFHATQGYRIRFDFTSFNLRNEGGDTLKIYDGPDTLAPLLASYTGEGLLFSVSSTDSALTFHFTSDASLTNSGWSAQISCCAIPVTSSISGDDSVCVGTGAVSYSVANTPGDVYTWIISGGTQISGSNSEAITVDWGSLPGNGSVSVVEDNGCTVGDTVVLGVTLNALPVLSFSGMDTLYDVNLDGLQPLTGNPAGGTFSGTGITDTIFDPSVAGTGTHEIIYAFTDSNSCSNKDTSYTLIQDYDFYTGARLLKDLDNWYSGNAAYTTVGATADGNTGSCWNYGNDHTRWFRFQATTSQAAITFLTGSVYGTARRLNAALWEADGITQINCNRYSYDYDSVTVQSPNLIPGNWYYVSVTSGTGGYAGSFSVHINDQVDYDYYEGAWEIPDLSGWISPEAIFTTVGATADGNAGSCWNYGNDHTRWFKFQATTNQAAITLLTGGTFGTARRINAALWEADGTTQLDCNRYNWDYDSVTVQSLMLVPGNWYYVSVTSGTGGYRGTFSVRVNDQVDYDYYEGAVELSDITNWDSPEAAYTTIGATADKNAASCWNTSPNYDRWFKFQATDNTISILVRRGGSYGTIRQINAAIWEADGITEVSCNRYIGNDDNVYVEAVNLTPGNWYYLSVDNNYSGYCGTFSLHVDTKVSYDYKEGAYLIQDLNNWCSSAAEFTTTGATADLNAASCWNTSPNYNRWFKFVAVTHKINVEVKRGDSLGTIRQINVAIWENDGTTEVNCNRFVNNDDDVSVGTDQLIPGNTYYISVDNYYSGYRGSFTLCVDDQMDYDYLAGAKDITTLINGCSNDAAYTTVGATSDGIAPSCWNTGPDYNRWFKFMATARSINVQLKRGGVYGTLRRAQLALFDKDSTTVLDCNRYVYNDDNIEVSYENLTPGAWYFLSVDNDYSGYRGTFTLCLDDKPSYDFYEGAIELGLVHHWTSSDAAYTTVGATPDKYAGSCWNTGPDYNRWFKFTATTSQIHIEVRRGGVFGTIRRINAAIWETDGETEVTCKKYVYNDDNVVIESTNLIPGNTYYLSVDNNYSGYRGTFSLYVNDAVGYDYYEGAKDVTSLINSQSDDAAYTTVGATPDKNAGSCWNTSPDYNRWFKFKATTPGINIKVLRGGSFGTVRRVNIALFDSDGTTELACNRYINNDDIVELDHEGLTPGNWYYFSVDNNYSGYRGSFALALNDAVSYDYYEGAYELTDIHNWSSDDAQFSTLGATPDKNAGSCWNTGPDYNRWFKFTATTPVINVEVRRGGSFGTVRRINAALWEADGVTQVACNRYVNNDDNVSIGAKGLVPGNTYYLSVDNNYSGYRGTFSLYVDNSVDYDFYEGAYDITNLNNWESNPAEFTTLGATPDMNAASCWNTGPDYNRWFKFKAISPDVSVQVLRGGSYGTVRRINLALWEADGTTELACNRYTSNDDNVAVTYSGLIPGAWYYISVDNNYSGYRGTFTLQVSNVSGNEYYAIADGNWNMPSSWSLSDGGPPAVSSPSGGDVVHIHGYNITVSDAEACAELDVAAMNGQTSLSIDGGSLIVNGGMNFSNPGNDVDAALSIINAGSLNVKDDLIIDRAGGAGTFQLLVQDASLTAEKDMNILSSAGTTTNNEITFSGTGSVVIQQDLNITNTGGVKSIVALNDAASLSVSRDIQFISGAADMVEIALNNNAVLYPGREIVRGATPYGIIDCRDNSTLVFNSADYLQTIPQNAGAGIDAFSYQNIVIDNSRLTVPQVRLEGPVSVPGTFTLTHGVVATSSVALLTIESSGSVTNGSPASYIDGPLEIIGDKPVTFPLGKNGRYEPLSVSAPVSVTDAYKAEYKDESPGSTYDISLHEASIDHVANCEYWTLERTSGTSSVNITASWDGEGCCISDMASLKVAVWDGSEWKNYGNGGTSGTLATGSITSSLAVGFNSCAITFADYLPIIDFTDPAGPYCETDVPVLLTGSPADANGSFSGDGITDHHDGTATFDPNATGKGTHQIIYNYVSASGCSNTLSKPVTVNPSPTATFLGTDTVCEGVSSDFSIYFTGIAPWDITYTDGTDTFYINTSANPYTITSNVPGDYRVIALSDAAGCSGNDFGNTASLINWATPAKPATSISSGNTTFCEGDTLVLETPPANLYYWNNGTSTRKNIITDPGNYWVKVVDNHGCFSDNSDTTSVTVHKTARKPSAITGDDALCQNNPNTIYTTSAWYADSYTWDLLPAGSGTVTGTGTSATVNWSNSFDGVAKLSVYASNANCGTGPVSDTLYISLGALPDDPGVISGDQTVCQGQTNVIYKINRVQNASSYSWNVPGNAVISGVTTDTSIIINYASNAVSGDVTVTALNTCGSSLNEAVQPVTVQLMSHAATGITLSDNNISPGDPVTLTVQGGSLGESAGWKWYLDAAGTSSAGPDGTTLSVNPSASTQYWVRAEGTCNLTGMTTVTVTVNPLPLKAETPVGVDELCQDAPDTDYSTAGATGATTYIWEVSPATAGTFSGSGTTGTINWSATWYGTAVITVKGQNASGTGPSSDPATVIIHKKPVTGPLYHLRNTF